MCIVYKAGNPSHIVESKKPFFCFVFCDEVLIYLPLTVLLSWIGHNIARGIGEVVSRLVCIEKIVGSIPTFSKLYFLSRVAVECRESGFDFLLFGQ
jgi:hypothetical protein